MIILGVDTTSSQCSVALWNNGRITVNSHQAQKAQHTEFLLPLIQKTLTESNQTIHTIDKFGIVVGPGSFTGIRAGLATVLGFRLVTGKYVCGFSTFEVFASYTQQYIQTKKNIAVILAGRYIQIFSPSLQPLTAPSRIQNIPQNVFTVSDQEPPQHYTGTIIQPDASLIATLTATKIPIYPPKPLYF